MAMGLTNQVPGSKVGQKYADQVTAFLNLEAVELADTHDVPDLSIFTCASGRHLQQYWDDLISKGVSIMVCLGCVAISGVTSDIVREGARMGDMISVQQLFLGADKVFFDY
ncbi:hypothetical protein NSMM_150116 [Nitrosomonas mobilis]|uniref:Uncharacterized protein n=2 Tax=Nitrosomonas mobilis TaxID=51642 RepID=A0A1G5SB85_9PROT|nr:hypothetical protein NSMM_150116 [Nitrosomonas mobilis]